MDKEEKIKLQEAKIAKLENRNYLLRVFAYIQNMVFQQINKEPVNDEKGEDISYFFSLMQDAIDNDKIES